MLTSDVNHVLVEVVAYDAAQAEHIALHHDNEDENSERDVYVEPVPHVGG